MKAQQEVILMEAFPGCSSRYDLKRVRVSPSFYAAIMVGMEAAQAGKDYRPLRPMFMGADIVSDGTLKGPEIGWDYLPVGGGGLQEENERLKKEIAKLRGMVDDARTVLRRFE